MTNHNLLSEDVLTLGQVASLRHIAFSTVYRWAFKGARVPGGGRLKLEIMRVGGRWVTSREALLRWSLALTEAHGETVADETAPRTSTQREREAAKAGKRLAEIGA